MKFKFLVKSKLVSSILGTLAVFLGIGFILPLNSFSVYITSYINLKDSYVTMHYGLFIHLFYSFANTFSHSLGGYLEHLLGFYKTLIVGYIIIFLANLGFIFQQNIWICYFLSFIFGIGAGISTSLLGKNLMLYCPDKKGVITSVLLLGVMIIATIFGFSGEKLINFEGKTLKEDEYFYPKEIAERTYLYFMIGLFTIPIGFIFSMLLLYEYKAEVIKIVKLIPKNREEEEKIKNQEVQEQGLTEKPKEENEIKEKNEENEENKENELNKKYSKQKLMQAIKTFRYLRIILISFFVNFSISFMTSTARTFGALIGINGKALQFARVIQTVAVLILGPVLGILIDKKGPLLLLRIAVLITIAPAFLLTFFMSYTVVFISCLVVYVLSIVGLAVGFGPFIMEIYGIQESVILGGIINGFSKFSDIFTTVGAFAFSIVCKDDKKEKECLKSKYAIMYFLSGVCCIISTILLLFESIDKFQYENIKDEDSLLEKNEENKILDNTPD